MGWGDAFANAWKATTDAGRAAASTVARTGRAAATATRQAATWTADKAVQGATWTADKAVTGAKWTADKAVTGARWTADKAKQGAAWADAQARDGLRAGQRNLADPAFDGLAKPVELGRRTGAAVRRTYAQAKEAFTGKPAGSPVQPCPGDTAVPGNDAKQDGWIMVPQGYYPNGVLKPCLAVPPGDGALAKARSQALVANDPCCQARRAGAAPREIMYVNGIRNTAQEHCSTLNAIAQQSCGRVVGVYNATEGGLLDAAQTGQDRRLIKAASAGKSVSVGDGRNPAVDTLSGLIRDEVVAGRPPEIWAHSQGGAVTSLSLYEARRTLAFETLRANPLEGMKVTSMGAAAPSWVNGPAYEHFIHVDDPVPSLFGLGHADVGDAANAGRGAQVIRFAGTPGGTSTMTTENNKPNYFAWDIRKHDATKSYLKMEKQKNGGCP